MTKGERLRLLRENIGLTLEEVADKLFITKQTIYKYEKDIVTNIPSNRLERLAEIYHTTPEFILGWENAPQTTSSTELSSDSNQLSCQRQLLALLDELNEAGQKKVIDYASDLVDCGKYQKNEDEYNLLQSV